MSEVKFTPGPWVVEQSEKTPIYVSPVGRHENISICNVMVMDEDDSESGDWINGDETKANAKLIAAAPDLYLALIEARQVIATALAVGAPDWFDSAAKIAQHATVKKIDAAIIKATA